MLSRPTIFGAGAVLIVLAGAIWIFGNASLRELVGTSRKNLPVVAVDNRANGGPARQVYGVSPRVISKTGDAGGPRLGVIRQLLNRQRRFGPAERGSEDEIRCALMLLLTDDNAEPIVRGLSPDELRTEFGAMALSRWAEKKGVAASLWLAQQPIQTDEQTWVVARALATDPIALDVLCDLLPASPWREDLLENASRASVADHPNQAIRLAECMQSGVRQTRMLAGIADEWVAREPADAARWIASEPDVFLRDELLFSGATARASVDPIGALDWANGIAANAVYERAIDRITSMWTDFTTEPAYREAVTIALRRGARGSREHQ